MMDLDISAFLAVSLHYTVADCQHWDIFLEEECYVMQMYRDEWIHVYLSMQNSYV